MEKQNSKFVVFLYEAVSTFVTAAIIIAILFTFFIRFIGVVGSSMNPTLASGDWVILNQVGVDYQPNYGDIVVINNPGELDENIIKRVIATEGQTVNINFQTGAVYIDGKKIVERYINNETTTSFDVTFPLTVPEGQCFVMGDNRQNSLDSRSTLVGCIDVDTIIGKAAFGITDDGFVELDVRNYQ